MSAAKRPTKKKKRSARELKKELRSIYSDRDGKMPDLTKLTRGGNSRFTSGLIKLIVFLLVISGLAWTGFFFFTQGLFQEGETLAVEIEGPEEVRAGEEVSYTIRYENTGAVPIASLNMKLNLPSTFHLYTAIPEATQNDEWTVGSLTPGSDGAVTLTGVFLAEVESSQRLQGLFTYKPANFSSEFQDIATKKVDIRESVVALTLSGPEKALAGDEAEYIINIQNTYTDPVYNLRIIPSLGNNFNITETDPEIPEGESHWSIDSLQAGELKAFTLRGTFTSSASGDERIQASVGFVDEDLYLSQAQEELITDVLGGALGFSMIINGSDTDQAAELGETLRLSMNVKNNGDESVEDVSLEIAFDGNGVVPIDWSGANLDDANRSGTILTFTSSTHEELETLNPGDEVIIDLTLPLFEALDSEDADSFTTALKATILGVGGVAGTREIETTPIEVRLNSDATASAHARYYATSGSEIGSGPLPPEVGETTSFRVYWNLSNGLHTLQNVEFTTTLPQDVAWLESTDTGIGSVDYNPTTRQVRWRITTLPTSVATAGAWFDVAINPTDSDVGRFMKLTNATAFSATDTETDEQLSQTLDNVTTDLILDEFADGQGVVLE